MFKFLHRSGIAAVLAVGLLAADPASAAHLFVSQFGNDAGDGSWSSPFRTLQAAADAASDGDVIQLEMGGDYGPVKINNKSLTIMSTTRGGIYSPGKSAIVFAGGANDVLTLIGLTIAMGYSPFNAIVFNAGLKLIMLDMLIQQGTGGASGLFFRPNTNSELNMRDTMINEFGTSGMGAGIRVAPRNGADVIGAIINTTILNSLIGLSVLAAAGSSVDLAVDPSYIGGGVDGVVSSGGKARVRIKDSVIANNSGRGLKHSNNGKIISLGGNSVVANGANGNFTSTVLPK